MQLKKSETTYKSNYIFHSVAIYDKAIKITHDINKVLEKENIDKNYINNINLILEEIILNICNYAYPNNDPGPLELELKITKDTIYITFKDQGIPFNPLEYKSKPISGNDSIEDILPGGLGIVLVKQFSKKIDYQYSNNKNILTISIGLDKLNKNNSK